jgi:hypothetical protein
MFKFGRKYSKLFQQIDSNFIFGFDPASPDHITVNFIITREGVEFKTEILPDIDQQSIGRYTRKIINPNYYQTISIINE